ncbi:MAG TPA: type II toxin-antitoxin system RelB/DinJ family antitoxin [Bacillota bacterium]|nr:type II toxin-antitoxin system RelB/DinJ family antitoxin [Bacillota bacterium]
MSQTNITIRMDRELKQEAEKLFNALGLNMTTAFTMFTKTAVREQRIPFELSLSSLNNQTMSLIREVEEGENLYGPFDTVTELVESLNAED